MTIVIADASPLTYLVLIDEIGILPRLYQRVIIPEDVLIELMDDEGAPLVVREWALQPPSWPEIRRTAAGHAGSPIDLEPGAASGIAMAELESGAVLLIDEPAGRLEASRRGLPNTGTLGVLRAAAMENLVELPSALKRLLATNFRISRALAADLIAEDTERKMRGG